MPSSPSARKQCTVQQLEKLHTHTHTQRPRFPCSVFFLSKRDISVRTRPCLLLTSAKLVCDITGCCSQTSSCMWSYLKISSVRYERKPFTKHVCNLGFLHPPTHLPSLPLSSETQRINNPRPYIFSISKSLFPRWYSFSLCKKTNKTKHHQMMNSVNAYRSYTQIHLPEVYFY